MISVCMQTWLVFAQTVTFIMFIIMDLKLYSKLFKAKLSNEWNDQLFTGR